MANKSIIKAIKVVVILGIIFCAISLLLPWRGFSMNTMSIEYGGNYYSWGSHSYMNIPSGIGTTEAVNIDIWSFFYVFNTEKPDISSLDSSDSFSFTFAESDTNMVASVLLIIAFVFVIIALVMGVFALKKKLACLFAGVSSVLSIVFFIVGTLVYFSMDPTGMANSLFSYTYGFFMIVIGMIMFFVAFGLYYLVKYVPVVQSVSQKRINPVIKKE